MKVLRYTFTIALLIVFSLPVVVDAKHIIVMYDISGSMRSLRINGTINTYMEPEDIRRLNNYLTDLLFTDTAQDLRDPNDSYIKKCELAYVSKPLYQSGDILTYATYARQRTTEISRGQVQRAEFRQRLPQQFPGQVSYLLRAQVEVYDELYRDADDETYWVFVTDGDVDNSGKSDPGIAEVLKRLAEIEEEYYDPMIFGIFVNKHVRIQVRRIQKRDNIDTIFIANSIKPKESVRTIQLSQDEEGQFTSETLTIDTENSEKAKFKLNGVNIEIVDKYNKPLQVVTQDGTTGLLEVPPVPLYANLPPYDFRILLPAHPEIATSGNALKLEVVYNYEGVDKDPYLVPLMHYTAVIDSVYVANLKDPDRPAKQVTLQFSKDLYHGDLLIQSESPNKKAFRINQIRCELQYKDGQKLFDAPVSPTKVGLGESFRIEVPKVNRLDWYGNKIVLDIDYEYENAAKSSTLEVPFELQGSTSGFLIWILIPLGLILLAVVIFGLIHLGRKWLAGPPIEYQIMLEEVDAEGVPLNERQSFPLTDRETVLFASDGDNGWHFDVGSPAVLRCRQGEMLLYENAHAEEGRILTSGETLILTRDEGDEVRVRFEILDDEMKPPSDSDHIIDDDDNLLPD